MGSMNTAAFLLIAAIMLSAVAEAQIGILPPVGIPSLPIPPILPPINNLNILGSLCCTANGACPGPPLAGVRVNITCTNILGASVVVGQGITGVNGRINITVANVLGLVPSLLPLPCRLSVALPLNQTVCAVLNVVNGTLTGVLTPVGLILGTVGGLLGNILQLLLTAVSITF